MDSASHGLESGLMDGIHLDSALIGSVIYQLISALIDSMIACRCAENGKTVIRIGAQKWQNGRAGGGGGD